MSSATITLVGPSTAYGAPEITPSAINVAINAALAANYGAVSGQIVTAAQSGLVGDGATDNHVILQALLTAAIAAGWAELRLPAGRFMCSTALSGTLTGNATFVVRGVAEDVTEVVFTTDTDGFVFTYASAADDERDTVVTGCKALIERMSIVRGFGTTGKDAVKFIGDTANASGTDQPQTMCQQLVIRGTSAGGGWNRGIVYQDVANTNTRSIYYTAPGSTQGGAVLSAVGIGIDIQTTGSRYSTLHTMYGVNVIGAVNCINIGQRIQGVEIVNSNLIGGIGINWNSVGRQEQLAVSNTEFSTLTAGIKTYNLQNVLLSNNVFYNQNAYSTTPGTWIAIWLLETDNSQITGNSVMGAGVGVEYGISITNDASVTNPIGPSPGYAAWTLGSVQPTAVSGNTFYNLTGQVLVTANSTQGVLFHGNGVAHCNAAPMAIGSGTGVATADNTFDGVLYGVGYPSNAGFNLDLTSVATAVSSLKLPLTYAYSGKLVGTTTSTTALRLTTDGLAPGAANLLNLPNGAACNLTVQVIGTDVTNPGNGVAATFSAVSYFEYYNTVSLGHGAPQTQPWGSGSSATVTVAADNTNKGLAITVQAPNTDTWRWAAAVTAISVL